MRREFVEACHAMESGAFYPITIDIETTIVDGSPDCKDGAKPVLLGYHYDGRVQMFSDVPEFMSSLYAVINMIEKPVILVGHNIKFDLKHLFHRYEGWMSTHILEHENMLGVWDTSIYSYLASGHTHKYPSLSATLKEYGIEETKIDEVTAIFKSGLGADHVEPELLKTYLIRDLEVTDELFRAQFACTGRKMKRLMFVQGWANVAYTRMESIGLPFDREALVELGQVLGDSADRLENVLRAWIYHSLGGKVQLGECKPTNRAISTVLFGHPGLPIKHKLLVGKYKNGKPKFKTEDLAITPPMPTVAPRLIFDAKEKPNPHLGYSTSDDVLDKIIVHEGVGSDVAKVCTLIKEWRKAQKIVGTYTKPLVEKLDASGTRRVYHTINNVVTNTGRTSSTNPNGQNMPEIVRACVKTAGHKVVQCDFSQLEMCAAAQLSKDFMLIHDVNNSDVHFETGKTVMGWRTTADMDKHSRRLVKGVNFGILYGGGPVTISKETGVPENLVKKQMTAFKARYPKFIKWQDDLKAVVVATPGMSPTFKDGEAYYKHPWTSVTGRVYMFPDSKRKWDGKIGPNPSAVVNYPVQGFATGDIVPLFIALLHGYSRMQHGWPFIAVHDSVAAIRKSTSTDLDVTRELRVVEQLLPHAIEQIYELELLVKLKLDIEIKDSWS